MMQCKKSGRLTCFPKQDLTQPAFQAQSPMVFCGSSSKT